MTGPLAGLRVLDLGTRIAAPFCAGLLGEQGAEVIKIEQPRGGDFMREIGPFVETDPADGETGAGRYSLFWAVEGRECCKPRPPVSWRGRYHTERRLFARQYTARCPEGPGVPAATPGDSRTSTKRR